MPLMPELSADLVQARGDSEDVAEGLGLPGEGEGAAGTELGGEGGDDILLGAERGWIDEGDEMKNETKFLVLLR